MPTANNLSDVQKEALRKKILELQKDVAIVCTLYECDDKLYHCKTCKLAHYVDSNCYTSGTHCKKSRTPVLVCLKDFLHDIYNQLEPKETKNE
jgi:hypothetical protein